MIVKTKAIVLKHTFLSENDKMLHLLSKDYGLIEAKARDVKRMKSPLLNSTEDCCYSEFCLFSGKSGYIVNSADRLENFFGLRNDIHKMSLASYLCELTHYLTPTAENAEVFLRLLCNSLYLLASDKRTPQFIKPIYEFRALCESGFTPNLVACDSCGAYEAETMFFYPLRGIILCDSCQESRVEVGMHSQEPCFRLPSNVLAALRHLLFSEIDKLFQFKVSPKTLKYLDSITEYYAKVYLERTLKTLEFYHSLESLI